MAIKTINIRDKVLFYSFAKEVSKERFRELFSAHKPFVISQAWEELLKATNRKDEATKETPKAKEIKHTRKRQIKKA